MESKFYITDTLQDSSAEKKDVAREGFSQFFEKFERIINGYFGTPDIQFTLKPGGWYIDLEKLSVNADPQFFIDKGYSESEALFASFHEAEHFRDMIRDNKIYSALFERFRASSHIHAQYPKAIQRLYNCLDDVLVNRAVIARWKSGESAKDSLYPKLFPSKVLASNPVTGKPEPRHRQFMYALLREAMLPREVCSVSDDVRAALSHIQQQGGSQTLVDILTAVDQNGEGVLKPEDRFNIIQGLIEPTFLELFKQDISDLQVQEKDGDSGFFGDDPFEDAIPDPIDFDDVEKEVKKIKDKIAKNQADEAKRIMGVSQEAYDKYKKDFDVVHPFIEELSQSFDDVIQRRKTTKRKLRRPVREGVILSSSRLAAAVAEIHAGNTDPRVMLDYETKDVIRISPSRLEFTLVCDGSGSMNHNKKDVIQRQMAVLVIEALREFQERLEKQRRSGEHITLDVDSEVRMFENNDFVLKPLSSSLTHAERVAMHERLVKLPGGSNNEPATFLAIRNEQFTTDRIEKMQRGEIKKVILFLTDGESESQIIQESIRDLERRASGDKTDCSSLIIAGIGFEGGESARTTYAPHGFYAENFKQVSEIFKKFLQEILEDV